MGLRKKLVTTLGAAALLVGVVLAAPMTANATGNPSHLDRGDFSQACQTQNGAAGWVANPHGTTAYSNPCTYTKGLINLIK